MVHSPHVSFDLLVGAPHAKPLPGAVGDSAPRPALRFKIDTLAFPNEIRALHPEKPDLYANWCFILARAVTQFLKFARFEPGAPRLEAAAYTALVRRVVSHWPWRAPLPPSARVAIPGFASLHALSRDEERAVKEGLGRRFWTLVHPTTWRIVYPARRSAQFRLVVATVNDLRGGRPVQLLLSDFPRLRLNHAVLAYDYRIASEDVLELFVYDPNDPTAPGVVAFDRRTARFRPAPLAGVDVPAFRVFRMYRSLLF
jgi:hypothetical protein